MQGISSNAATVTPNKFKYNGKEEQRQEFSDGSGLEWVEFGARMNDIQIGRWVVQDPMAGKYFSSTPYNYVDGNPIIRIDPDGQDWFKNEKTGEVSWREIEGKQGQQLSLKGSEDTWTNLGSELLEFNGMYLTYYTQLKDKDGNLSINAQIFDAVSGRPIESDEHKYGSVYNSVTGTFETKDLGPAYLTFEYSKERQGIENVGPAPEGVYSLNKSKFIPSKNENGLQNWSDLNIFQKVASTFFESGAWAHGYGTSSWGDHRWRLKLEDVETTRYGFFIHGSSNGWGSAGCIDLGLHTDQLVQALSANKNGNDKVYINVVYLKDLKFTIQNTSNDKIIRK